MREVWEDILRDGLRVTEPMLEKIFWSCGRGHSDSGGGLQAALEILREAKAAGVLTKAEKKAQGPKRPLSAYMHFCAERRPSLTEELKAQLGADFKYTLVMTKLGEEWRGVGDKSKYEAMAAADKASKAA